MCSTEDAVVVGMNTTIFKAVRDRLNITKRKNEYTDISAKSSFSGSANSTALRSSRKPPKGRGNGGKRVLNRSEVSYEEERRRQKLSTIKSITSELQAHLSQKRRSNTSVKDFSKKDDELEAQFNAMSFDEKINHAWNWKVKNPRTEKVEKNIGSRWWLEQQQKYTNVSSDSEDELQ